MCFLKPFLQRLLSLNLLFFTTVSIADLHGQCESVPNFTEEMAGNVKTDVVVKNQGGSTEQAGQEASESFIEPALGIGAIQLGQVWAPDGSFVKVEEFDAISKAPELVLLKELAPFQFLKESQIYFSQTNQTWVAVKDGKVVFILTKNPKLRTSVGDISVAEPRESAFRLPEDYLGKKPRQTLKLKGKGIEAHMSYGMIIFTGREKKLGSKKKKTVETITAIAVFSE